MTTGGRRAERVAELLRSELADVLRRELDDPRLVSLVITTVNVSDDLSGARIGVRLLTGDEQPGVREELLKHLVRANGRISRAVRPRLDLRRSLALRFTYDDGHDATARVTELLREIAAEPKARDPE